MDDKKIVKIDEETSAEVDTSKVFKLVKPVTFEGKEYTEIDLAGLEDLNGRDIRELDRLFKIKGGRIAGNVKEFDSLYLQLVAAKGTGLPLEFFDVGIREHIRKLAFGLELAGNRFHIFGRLLDVVTRALVAGFNHFSEFHNDDFLHAPDTFVLLLHTLDKVIGIAGHRVDRLIKMLNFVIGINPDFSEAFHAVPNAFQIYRFGIQHACATRAADDHTPGMPYRNRLLPESTDSAPRAPHR